MFIVKKHPVIPYPGTTPAVKCSAEKQNAELSANSTGTTNSSGLLGRSVSVLPARRRTQVNWS